LLVPACGSGRGDATPPPTSAPIVDVGGIGIAVYAPRAAYEGTLADDTDAPAGLAGVAVFGDSLTVQAWDYLRGLARYGGLPFSGDRISGTALCDWREEIDQRLAGEPPAFLVFGFAGNNVTDCTGRATGSALGDVYERDAREVVAQARRVGTHVVIVGPPDMGVEHVDRNATAVRAAFEHVAQEAAAAGDDGVTYADGRDTISPRGFSGVARCESWESEPLGCHDGEIPIRHPDGIRWSQPDAYGYSGGSWRWAATMFSEVPPAPGSEAARD
jgi:hypothetical protein